MNPRHLTFVATLSVTACGGSHAEHPAQTTASAAPDPSASQDDHAGGLVIEGQLGFLSQEQLEGVLRPATSQLAGCYNDRLAENSYLSGRIEIKIRIGADGTPRWVIPTSTSVGDRPTEACIVQRAMALHFPAPRGGETETSYPLEFAGGDDARPAVEWPATRIDHAVTRHRSALEGCTHGVSGPFVVTLYAAPHGRVSTAGVSIPSETAVGAVDCLVHEVTSWHVPDPGSWYAKTSITLQ